MIPTVLSCRLRDLDLADAGDSGALRHVEGQQPGRVRSGFGLHRPPDLVPAGVAGGQRRLVAQRLLCPLNEAKTTPHSRGWWRWRSRYRAMNRMLPPRARTDVGRPP